MKNIFKTIFFFLALFLANFAFAADFQVSRELPKGSDIKVGDEILLNVNFFAEGVNYNAFEGKLSVPDNFEILKTVTGNSFVTIWLEDPANFTGNTIRFSGITPAGHNKENGILFSVILKAGAAGQSSIEAEDFIVYENDGLGTPATIGRTTTSLFVRELGNGEEPYLIAVKDSTPPEEFKIELLRDENLYDGKYTLVWSAIDKGSGIKSYDLFERNNVFKHVSSPYVLENQRLNGKIKVVAYDYEGNTREASIIPPGKSCIGDTCFGLIETSVVLLVLVIILFAIWRKRK